ncbi:contractile injection system protein, VgrG/Pvc8 family [Magnetofaba australis]|uniref:Uncharacterized protein n=1 Tax=Magnetofaba australis IT-1 TaxID=1434232 RepID=A0A1Y2K0X3_9PROT|nr:contractile injection system protein, VgrG/Pvc8 family [Magnetofaba australis]OSM01648.1 hypothetical protein MAIT1_01663 [Magnetofaba australis IT-1]
MQPIYKIEADSKDITANLDPLLIALSVSDKASMKSDSASITLDDDGGRIAPPRLGAQLKLFLGYAGQGLIDLGQFVVDAVEMSGPPRQMRIRANAADMRSALRAPIDQSWRGQTLGAIVQTIAKRHELTPSIEPKLAAILIAHIDQTKESDANFIARLAHKYDAVVKIAQKQLVFVPKDGARSVGGAPLKSHAIPYDGIVSWSVTLADRNQYNGVEAYWHDLDQAQSNCERAGAPQQPIYRIPTTYPTAEAARAAAKSYLNKLTRTQASLSLTLPGRPEIQAEEQIVLSGFGPLLDGAWTVESAQHDLDAGRGLSTRLETSRPVLDGMLQGAADGEKPA